MKGIILAGGSGTRLHPITKGISKQLLPIYDKPMIYYPLSVLMLANIKEILIISTAFDIENYKKLLGDGSCFGLKFEYKVQDSPKGIPEALILGEEFINGDKVCLILGDNLFYGQGLTDIVREAKERNGATVTCYSVKDPARFGVIKVDNGKVTEVHEKPKEYVSNLAITGLYFFDEDATKFAKTIKPSARGELEMMDLHKIYLEKGLLNYKVLGRGFAWIDTGTFDSLIDAATFVKTIQSRQGFKIACIEEIAYANKWISSTQLRKIIENSSDNDYKAYLERIFDDE